MKVGGIYFNISYGKPETRTVHMEHEFLGFDLREFVIYDSDASEEEREEKTHYIYVCTKVEGADALADLHYERVMEMLVCDNDKEKALAGEDQD